MPREYNQSWDKRLHWYQVKEYWTLQEDKGIVRQKQWDTKEVWWWSRSCNLFI